MMTRRALASMTAVVLLSPGNAFVAHGPVRKGSSASSYVACGVDRKCAFSFVRTPTERAFAGATARRASPPRKRQAAATLKAVSDAGSGDEDEGRDMSGLRRAALLTVWLVFSVYALGPFSPGANGDPKDLEIAKMALDPSMLGPKTALFFWVFNSLGVIPLTFAALLCGGGAFCKDRQPVPALPFVLGSLAMGFFSLGPYLAVRNYLPDVDADEEPGLLEKIFTSKLLAIPLLTAAACCLFGLITTVSDPAAVSGYSELFASSKLVNTSSLDAIVLSVAIIDPLREDMRRRGYETDAAKVAPFMVPLVGPALWLAIRPPVVKS